MKVFLFSLALLLAAGCSAGIGYADRSISPAFIEDTVLSNHNRVQTLLGSGTISVETPEIAQNVSFELTLRKPDSVMVRIEGPFGIDLGLALLTRREFSFYNSMNNQLLSGPTNPTNLARVLRIRMEFDDLLNLFSGGTFLAADRGRPSKFDVVEDEYVLTYEHERGSRRYQVDPRSFQIVKIEHLDQTGGVVVEQTFGKFLTEDGTIVPQLVRALMRLERRRLSIAYSDLVINPQQLEFHFDVPTDAERVRLP
ncbi:MAG: DUF4292 domain-containing protein [Bacteroidota bacterium]